MPLPAPRVLGSGVVLRERQANMISKIWFTQRIGDMSRRIGDMKQPRPCIHGLGLMCACGL
jgi:hypothetical protein